MAIKNSDEVTVVMVPLPAQGHLNQLLHLSRLISSYNIPVHYVSTPAHTRQAKSRVHGWDPSSVHFHHFPVPPYENPPPDPTASTRFPAQLVPAFFASTHLREPTFQLVQKLAASAKRVVVIHDSLMPYVIQDVQTVPNAETYAFQSISAFSVLAYVWEGAGKPDLPESPLYQNLEKTVTSELFGKFMELHFVETKVVSSGNLFNSCRAIEGPFLDRLSNFEMSGSKKNWAVGPFNPVVLDNNPVQKTRHECLDWLDKQPPGSVMFMSFGSTTSVTDEEIKEIAIGLERSEQRFIWVVRDADKGDVFAEGDDRKSNLPEGFESRIHGRGMVIRDWAPQLEILGHSSTGGFLSHCGWNSCMESISHGVPIAAWPMHSDQPRNSLLITEVLKIGVRVGDSLSIGDELVTSERVETAVRRLMDSEEGDEVRRRAKELSRAVKDSITQGASRLEMDSFVAHIRR